MRAMSYMWSAKWKGSATNPSPLLLADTDGHFQYTMTQVTWIPKENTVGDSTWLFNTGCH